jgi:hypothetical protein
MSIGFLRELKAPRKGRFSFASAICFVGAALLILSWLTTEHFLPWVSWHSEVLAFAAVVAVALAVTVAALRNRQELQIRVPLLAAPFALLGAIALVQMVTGTLTFWGDAITFCFYAAMGITCVVLGFNSAPGPDTQSQAAEPARWSPLAWVALAFVVGSCASVIVAFAQVFELWESSAWIMRMPELRRPGANLGQPNQLATLLVMGITSVAYLHVSGKLGRVVAALLVLLLCTGLAMSESRSGVLGLLALLLWWQIKRKAVASEVSPWAGPAVGAVFLLLFIGWPHILNALQLISFQAANRFTQGDLRLAMWSQLLEAIWHKPWWGWGMLQVAAAHNSVADAYRVNNPFSYSHNLVIDLGVWMGVPIAMGLTVLAVTWGARRGKSANRLLPWYCIAIAVPLGTHSMLEFPFAYAYFLAPALYLLGVLEGSMQARPFITLGTRTAAAMLVVLGSVLLWSVVEYLLIEEDFRIVRFEQLRIGKTPDHQQKPNVVLLTQLGALLDGSRIALEPGMSPDKLEQLRRLAMRYPWVATQYRYALALALNGNPAESVRQLQVLRWQRDEKTYASIKRELNLLALSRYPQLQTLKLP